MSASDIFLVVSFIFFAIAIVKSAGKNWVAWGLAFFDMAIFFSWHLIRIG